MHGSRRGWQVGAWPVAVLLSAGAAGAQQVEPAPLTVVSAGPASVAVTIYRAPGRASDAPFSTGWLDGYALISEERDVELPTGGAILRFEGVAAGMLAESAIVSGLPGGVTQKNLDADLLSPRNLYARAFGRPVVLRRLHPGSGQVEEETAIIRSGPDGAAVLQTRAGFELANCGGLRDSIIYPGLPQGLNSRPTLSVATKAAQAAAGQAAAGQAAAGQGASRRVRVRLSYLAWGFDWQAHYVLAMAPGARQAKMTAWLTLASSDDTGFPAAAASVVAGQPHFDEARPAGQGDEDVHLRCGAVAPPPPPPMPVAMALAAPMMDITVTAARRMMKAAYTAQAENLGDLHLYRIPVATTVAAHAQKQVALMTDRSVKLALMQVATIEPDAQGAAQSVVRLRNRRENGLGLALPGGGVSVMQRMGGGIVPIGEGIMADKAEGETIDVVLDIAPTVRLASVVTPQSAGEQGAGQRHVRLTVINDNRWPVHFEGSLALAEEDAVVASSARLVRKNGKPMWATVVPARGRAVLTYMLRRKAP